MEPMMTLQDGTGTGPSAAGDRADVTVLDTEQALELLASQPVGRIAFCDRGQVHLATVNHAVDGWSVVFRTSYGRKLIAASSESEVVFQVDDYDAPSRTGWSVLVRGTAEAVHDAEVTDRLERLHVDTWADTSPHDVWIRIHFEEITGRHISRRD